MRCGQPDAQGTFAGDIRSLSDQFVHLLRESTAARHAACERERLLVRERLTTALGQVLPRGSRGWIYGSLIEPVGFREWSDVDAAGRRDPPAG